MTNELQPYFHDVTWEIEVKKLPFLDCGYLGIPISKKNVFLFDSVSSELSRNINMGMMLAY